MRYILTDNSFQMITSLPTLDTGYMSDKKIHQTKIDGVFYIHLFNRTTDQTWKYYVFAETSSAFGYLQIEYADSATGTNTLCELMYKHNKVKPIIKAVTDLIVED